MLVALTNIFQNANGMEVSVFFVVSNPLGIPVSRKNGKWGRRLPHLYAKDPLSLLFRPRWKTARQHGGWEILVRQQVKIVLVAKPDNWSFVPGTQVIEAVLWPPIVCCDISTRTHMRTHIHTATPLLTTIVSLMKHVWSKTVDCSNLEPKAQSGCWPLPSFKLCMGTLLFYLLSIELSIG